MHTTMQKYSGLSSSPAGFGPAPGSCCGSARLGPDRIWLPSIGSGPSGSLPLNCDQTGSVPDQSPEQSPYARYGHRSPSVPTAEFGLLIGLIDCINQVKQKYNIQRWYRTTHLPVLMLDNEPVGLGSSLWKAFPCHLTALLDSPIKQKALVGFEQLQLVGLLQLLLPEQAAVMFPFKYISNFNRISINVAKENAN